MKNKILYILPSLVIGIIIGYVAQQIYETHVIDEINRSRLKLTPIDSLKSKVWLTGDQEAYAKLQGVYRDSYPPHYFLFWAMYMANKYDYPYAYEDVYYSIEENYYPSDSALFKMDTTTRMFALHYLKLAAQKNDSNAIMRINEMKEKHFPADWFK